MNGPRVCPLCGGTLERRTITHAVVHGNRVIVFQDVPAAVCRQCGEPYFAGAVVDQMNQFAWTLPEAPGGELSVYVHSLALAPATA